MTLARRKWPSRNASSTSARMTAAGNHAGVEFVHLDVLFGVGVDFHLCHQSSAHVVLQHEDSRGQRNHWCSPA